MVFFVCDDIRLFRSSSPSPRWILRVVVAFSETLLLVVLALLLLLPLKRLVLVEVIREMRETKMESMRCTKTKTMTSHQRAMITLH